MDTVERACEVAAAAMEWDWQPEYNNGHTIIPTPAEAIRPAIEALANAGLLAVRAKPTPIDQLAPGDRIWLDDAWREVGDAVDTGDGEIVVYYIGTTLGKAIERRFTAPAALLVRRAER
jgi:hypothetical protein